MKLLRITAEGLPLFKEKLDLSFYAQQRVTEEQKNILYPLKKQYLREKVFTDSNTCQYVVDEYKKEMKRRSCSLKR